MESLFSKRTVVAAAGCLALSVMWRTLRTGPFTSFVKDVPEYVIVGDVHGCADELKLLLTKANFVRGKSKLVFVGDLVGKGPKSVEVVSIAQSLNALAVMGNHDFQVIKHMRMDPSEGPPLWQELGSPTRTSGDHFEIAQHLSKSQANWLWNLPLILRLPKYNVVVVHAGLLPQVPFDEQQPAVTMWMRNIERKDGDLSPSEGTSRGDPWIKQWKGPELVLFGHDAARGLQQTDHAIGLDTGCVYGNKLTAYLLPQRQLVQVDALQEYVPKNPDRVKSLQIDKCSVHVEYAGDRVLVDT